MEITDTLFDEILEERPSPGTLYLVLSRMKKEGQSKKVIQECLKALELYPRDIHIRRLLAETYFEEGQVDEAGSALEQVIGQVDELISCYSLQTEIFIRQEREKEAVESLKLYLAHRPDDKEAFNLLDELQPEEEILDEPALPDDATPEDTEALPDIATPTLAEIHFDQGQIKEAVETYEKVISQNPDDIKSRDRLDELKGMMGQDQAEEIVIEDKTRQKKKRLIALLESWLAAIQERSQATGMVSG